jgi:glyoxalase/bleomycin resistance protein/dioxygenase superfamily protein
VRWCFHTTAMVADYSLTRDALVRLVGCRVLEDERIEEPAIGRRGGMTWIGDNSLELGEPIVPGGSADRFVERFGSHMSSIAVQVADIDATVAHLSSHGARIAARVEAEGSIVFTHPADTAGVVVEWYGGRPPNDPRFGTPIPSYVVPPVLDVTHMAFGGAVVADPPAAASQLALLLDTGVTFVDPSAPPGAPEAGVSLGDMTLALYRLPASPSESLALWGHAYGRPQTSSLGVRVPDLEVARSSLAAAGVPVVRADDRCVVVHPSATGGVSLVVVDSLLPNDPRLLS